MSRTILLFLDGVGIGDVKADNPFHFLQARYLPFYPSALSLPDGTPVKPIACHIDLKGIPQSATCQTALFTGAKGKKMGREHLQGYPNRRLRRLIAASNIFTQLAGIGKTFRFLNAYPFHASYFTAEHLRINQDGRLWFSPHFPARWRRMISVTTSLLITSGQRPLDENAIRRRKALYQDYSNDSLIRQGAELPRFSPEEAAEVLFHASAGFDFSLYEYFQTDLYAHRRSYEEAVGLVAALDRLVGRLISLLNGEEDTLVLTSDHGNIEDYSIRSHTQNAVPFLAWGKYGKGLRRLVDAISDVTPAIVSCFSECAP